MRAPKAIVVVAGTLLIVLAATTACSSSSSDTATSDVTPSSVSTTTARPVEDTTDSDGGSTNDPESLGGAFGSSDCIAAFTAYTALYAEVGGFAAGADQNEISDFEQKTVDLEGKVPEAVRDDFRTVAAAYKQYAEAVKDIDFADLLNSDTQHELEQASSALNEPAVKDAQGRIDSYFTTTCGT